MGRARRAGRDRVSSGEVMDGGSTAPPTVGVSDAPPAYSPTDLPPLQLLIITIPWAPLLTGPAPGWAPCAVLGWSAPPAWSLCTLSLRYTQLSHGQIKVAECYRQRRPQVREASGILRTAGASAGWSSRLDLVHMEGCRYETVARRLQSCAMFHGLSCRLREAPGSCLTLKDGAEARSPRVDL